jgi:hypothetical protein
MSTTVETTTAPEPKFSELGPQLAQAEAIAKTKGADATAARAQKSSIAVSAIHAAVNEKIEPENVKNDLLFAGVLKGTVSKIVTVINAVNAGTLSLDDVVSLSGAYTAVTSPKDKDGKPQPKVKIVTETKIKEVPVPAKYTKKGAIEFLVSLITDPAATVDEAERQGSDILTKVTREVSKAVKARQAEEDGEAE